MCENQVRAFLVSYRLQKKLFAFAGQDNMARLAALAHAHGHGVSVRVKVIGFQAA